MTGLLDLGVTVELRYTSWQSLTFFDRVSSLEVIHCHGRIISECYVIPTVRSTVYKV